MRPACAMMMCVDGARQAWQDAGGACAEQALRPFDHLHHHQSRPDAVDGLQGALDAEIFRISSHVDQRAKRKVFLIPDNLPVHHAKVLRPWLEKHKERIELFFMPGYSPELNPVEVAMPT
ncbi:MAG: transposase [Flavobacteriales bacterium]|nr:transposase [Flavobacteriales bacterium]